MISLPVNQSKMRMMRGPISEFTLTELLTRSSPRLNQQILTQEKRHFSDRTIRQS
jgi:hypothetical protein